MRRASRTLRAIGPKQVRVGQPASQGCVGTAPCVGLWPTRPQNAAGMRIEPPVSEPSESGPSRAATAAPAPPDEPPGVRSRFHGFDVRPYSADSVVPQKQNSGFVVLAKITAPAASRRSTGAHERSGTKPRSASRAVGRLHACQPRDVLDRERHAQEAAARAVRPRPVGRHGPLPRAVVEPVAERVQRPGEAVGPCEHGLQRLDGRELAAVERGDEVRRVEQRRIAHELAHVAGAITRASPSSTSVSPT